MSAPRNLVVVAACAVVAVLGPATGSLLAQSTGTPVFAWNDWNSYDQITILVGRVTVTDVTLPSGGTVQVAGVRYVVGAGYQL